MKGKRVLASALIMTCCMCLTGCFDRAELEEQAFLVTLGIDKTKSGLVVASARVAIPSKLSGSTGGGGSGGSADFQKGTPLISATGRNLNEAINLLNTGIEREINLSHLADVMFSERAARQGLLSQFHTLVRYREFRRALYMFVIKGRVSDVLQQELPVLETSATRFIEDMHELSLRTGYAPTQTIQQFLSSMEAPNSDPMVPIIAVNDNVGKEANASAGRVERIQRKKVDFSPGHIGRSGGNPVECVGTAIFRADRMVGTLDGEETQFLQLLSGFLHRVVLTVPTPVGSPGFLAVGVRYAKPASIKVDLHGENPKIAISQSFEAELFGDPTNASFVDESSRAKLERATAGLIRAKELAVIQKVLKTYRSDPFHFFERARGQFATYDQLMRYNWHSKMPLADVNLQTEVIVRRLGMEMNPTTAK